ncbi:sensor domain-containing diguanylate cyclase [Bacillaceae bacterium S4-13-58]
MVSPFKSRMIWIVWLVFWPTTLFLVYQYSGFTLTGREFDLISFVVLMSIVAFFPIVVNETPIFFIHGISLVVFLYFGLFTEILLTTIAVFVLIGKVRVRKNDLYRIPLNLLMFSTISIIGALVFYALGGKNGEISLVIASNMIPIVGYALAVFISNQLILYVISTKVIGRKERFFDKGLLWESMTSLFVLPVGLVLYIMYTEIGAAAIYYVGLPFVSLSIILTLYYSSQRINNYLQKASEIGHLLSGRLEVSEVLDTMVAKLSELLPLDYLYVYDVEGDKELHLMRFFDSNEKKDRPNVFLQKFEGISGKVWGHREGVLYRNRKEWAHLTSGQIPSSVESIISILIERDHQPIGVLTVASNKKRAYEKFQYMILDILGNHLAVALENAKHYEETKNKSERCPLTKLYNYRYFEDRLIESFSLIDKNSQNHNMSLILLDLDHFKLVNDTYGHQSGNEILCEVANRLTNIIGDKGIVARYGGEEFVILLPKVNREHCLHIAENIRRKIANHPFLVHEHILDDPNDVYVTVTASIGIATYPEDCEDAMDLVRHADRAMYLGAKRRGRNKVASYATLSEAAE